MRNAFKAALWTVLWTVLPTTLLAISGWLNDCMEWAADMADGGEQLVQFPDPSVLFGVLLGFVFSMIAGVVVFVIRYAQNRGSLPGESPVFDTTNKP